jgi:hypothetical protein
MSEPMDVLRSWLRQTDSRAFDAMYRAVSVSTAATTRRLERARRPFLLGQTDSPRLEDLDRSAAWLIEQSRASTGTLGGIAGLGGWMSLPPEAVAFLVACLRLGQRMAVVYGFDPERRRGRMIVARALAAGFEVELADRGVVGTRVSEVVKALATRTPNPNGLGGQLAIAVTLRAVRMMSSRAGRLVPVVSSGVSVVDNRRKTDEIGRRMQAVFRQLSDLPMSSSTFIEDAQEV